MILSNETIEKPVCKNQFLDPESTIEYFKYHFIDYDKIVDNELAYLNVTKLTGYSIESFDKYDNMELGFPFFRVVEVGTRYDMKTIVIGAPLFND
jgi:hypothetical protein